MKKVLILNSHSFSDYSCPQKYKLVNIDNLRPLKTKESFYKGTIWALFLEVHYEKIKTNSNVDVLTEVLAKANEAGLNLTLPEALVFYTVYFGYLPAWQHFDYRWKVVATESGFSKVLYEDDENVVLYEGRPDLVVLQDGVLTIVDHKTRSLKSNIPPYNNQVLGYCWGTGARHFTYNYTTWNLEGRCEYSFERESFRIPVNLIKDWEVNAISLAKRILADTEYPKVFDQCNKSFRGLYGSCPYIPLCTTVSPKHNKYIREKRYIVGEDRKSW